MVFSREKAGYQGLEYQAKNSSFLQSSLRKSRRRKGRGLVSMAREEAGQGVPIPSSSEEVTHLLLGG